MITSYYISIRKNEYINIYNVKSFFIPYTNNYKFITLVEAVSATSRSIIPIVIFKVATLLKYLVVDLPNKHLISIIKIGNSNNIKTLA